MSFQTIRKTKRDRVLLNLKKKKKGPKKKSWQFCKVRQKDGQEEGLADSHANMQLRGAWRIRKVQGSESEESGGAQA